MSTNFNVIANIPAGMMAFGQQPTDVVSGQPFSPVITVTGANTGDMVTILSATPDCFVTGTRTVTATSAAATFTGVGMYAEQAPRTCRLRVHNETHAGTPDIISNSFQITTDGYLPQRRVFVPRGLPR
jgi:hypothetical protein